MFAYDCLIFEDRLNNICLKNIVYINIFIKWNNNFTKKWLVLQFNFTKIWLEMLKTKLEMSQFKLCPKCMLFSSIDWLKCIDTQFLFNCLRIYIHKFYLK